MTDEPNTGVQPETETGAARASREATGWLILLQEEPGDPDLQGRFNAWLDQSPQHRAAWSVTRQTADLIAATPPAYAARWAPNRAPTPAPTPEPAPRVPTRGRRAGRGRRWGRGLAAIAAAACLAALVLPGLLLEIRADHRTGTAETSTLQLQDGSTVVLGPESAIAITDNAETRGLALLAGEAFFQVAPDPDRPFEVEVGDVTATVVGTAFNVLRAGDGTLIALQEGRVRVSHTPLSATDADPGADPAGWSETLAAGQVVQVDASGAVARGRTPPALIAAWRNGQLIAEDQPIDAVIDRLRRYYPGAILVAGRGLADRTVTGVYTLADPVEALRGIARAHGARVRQITPWLVVISGP